MKVNSQRDISFKSIYTNRAVKKGLEFASDYGALFAATASVGFSMARPLAIWMTPKTERENRALAVSKSLSSSFTGFILAFGLSVPLGKSISKIDKHPEKFLSASSLEHYKGSFNNIRNSKAYEFGTQLFKLGLGALVAIPKSVIVAAGVPYIAKKLFIQKNEYVLKSDDSMNLNNKNKDSAVMFKARPTEKIARGIGKILDKKWFMEFADKYKDTNFPMHIAAITDTIATLSFLNQINKKKTIEENRKKTLMYNASISTGLCIAGSYITDKILDKPTQKFIEKYKRVNQNDKNVAKQIQGIKIVKPLLILGSIYYLIIPFISTFLAERTKNHNNKNIEKL